MNGNDVDELRDELMRVRMFVIAVKTRFYLAMCGWAGTASYLFMHLYFDH